MAANPDNTGAESSSAAASDALDKDTQETREWMDALSA